MKYLWLDLLIAFLIWQLSIYTYRHTTQDYYLSQEVNRFNYDVQEQNILKDYHIEKETNPNNVSVFIEKISDISRQSIKTSVDIVISFIEDFR